MNRFIQISICAFLSVAAGCVHAQAVWRLASGYGESSYHTVLLKEFATEVGRATQGRVQILVHPNNSLVKLADIRPALGAGTIEAGEVILTGIAKEFSLAGADAVPFVVHSMNDAQRLWTLQRPALEKQLGAKGLQLLYSVPWPSQGLYSTRPITTPKDFAQLKMRTYNATTVRIAELLSAQPVEVPMVKVAEALGSGQMETMISSAVTGVENKVWSHLKFFYEINAWIPKNAVLVRADVFAKLSPADQEAVRRAALEIQSKGWAITQQIAQGAVLTLKTNGVKIEPLPPGLAPTFTAVGERLSREWAREAGIPALELFIAYFLKQPT
jgi:TRAP-type transport system periplasmic protein